MREAAFVKQNEQRWGQFESLLKQTNSADPDTLADYFVRLTDDLAYAQTHYPQSNTARYLNNLAAQVHQAIYRNKKEDRGRVSRFWRIELPQLYYEARRPLLYAFLIFVLSMGVGALSAAHDDTFVRLILGDAYVNMTLDNIERGDPMGVYKDMQQSDMFFAITFNNVRVSFLAFVLGLLASVGTGFMLFYNGVMVGVFQYFFYQKGLLLTSFLTIWTHGTLEISAIVLAGAAGLVMGNSLLFPGTYPRGESFRRGARRGLKMVIGLVPIFITAGFLEAFVTRLTEWPMAAKLAIIGSSACFIIYYFIVYPLNLNRHGTEPKD
ncbi:MAG: stage II sporulation protein M [Tunicatimonas sp.]